MCCSPALLMAISQRVCPMTSGQDTTFVRGVSHSLGEVLPSATEPAYGNHQWLAAATLVLTSVVADVSASVHSPSAQTANAVAARKSSKPGPRHERDIHHAIRLPLIHSHKSLSLQSQGECRRAQNFHHQQDADCTRRSAASARVQLPVQCHAWKELFPKVHPAAWVFQDSKTLYLNSYELT